MVTITAPTNAKLPDGGGYPVSTYQLLRPGANTATSRTATRSPATTATGPTTGTAWTSTVNSRLRNGLTLQIGIEHGPRA